MVVPETAEALSQGVCCCWEDLFVQRQSMVVAVILECLAHCVSPLLSLVAQTIFPVPESWDCFFLAMSLVKALAYWPPQGQSESLPETDLGKLGDCCWLSFRWEA